MCNICYFDWTSSGSSCATVCPSSSSLLPRSLESLGSASASKRASLNWPRLRVVNMSSPPFAFLFLGAGSTWRATFKNAPTKHAQRRTRVHSAKQIENGLPSVRSPLIGCTFFFAARSVGSYCFFDICSRRNHETPKATVQVYEADYVQIMRSMRIEEDLLLNWSATYTLHEVQFVSLSVCLYVAK